MSGSHASAGGAQLVTMLVTFLIFMIPIALLNANIARRKGKNPAEFGWLSVIPFVGYFLVFYLVSLTDKALQDKVDRILALVSQGAPGAGAGMESAPKDPWVNRPPQ